MSWLTDTKPFSQNSKKEKRRDWGFLCGYCNNSFFCDMQQLEDHQKVGEHKMCKGENDKYDRQLAIERGLRVD